MRHLYKGLAAVALLLVIIGIYRKSYDLERADLRVDLPVRAASASSAARVTSAATLTATRPTSAQPSDAAWSDAIDSILRDNLDASEKSQRMLQIFPHLPATLQAEAAQHLVNFATDSAPQTLLEPLLNTNTDPSAQGVLLLGLLQRADKIRLPALLQIARNADHPKCADALQYLQFLLESDHREDWSKWEQAVEARLKQTEADG